MAGESLKNNFKKGLTTLAILSLLDQQQMYGYELVQALEQHSNGKFTMRETALYPVLYRLEDMGMITAEKVLEGRRRVRVYYRLTPQGKTYLTTIREEYAEITAGIQLILAYTEGGESHE